MNSIFNKTTFGNAAARAVEDCKTRSAAPSCVTSQGAQIPATPKSRLKKLWAMTRAVLREIASVVRELAPVALTALTIYSRFCKSKQNFA